MLAREMLRRSHTLGLSLSLLAACVTLPPQDPPAFDDTFISPHEAAPTPVIRQGRYTLVELLPEFAQQNLQCQVVDLRIPTLTDITTVGDAMRYVLRHSGYQLCDSNPTLMTLWTLPLPAAHLRLGPLPLNQALRLLAGTTWRLLVDERERQICFAVNPTALPTEMEASP